MRIEPSNETKALFALPPCVVTRAEAIENGDLVDVTAAAMETGLRVPVAMTANAYSSAIAWSEQDSRRQLYQRPEDRLTEVIEMAAIRAQEQPNRHRILFNVRLVPRDGVAARPKALLLKLVAGQGDAGEPVATILLPNEN